MEGRVNTWQLFNSLESGPSQLSLYGNVAGWTAGTTDIYLSLFWMLDLVPGGVSLPGLQTAAFLLCLYGSDRALVSPSKGPNPITGDHPPDLI